MLTLADTFAPWDIADFERLAGVRFPHRCSIRRPVWTPDGSGGGSDLPVEVATVSCALTRMLTPREIVSGEGAAGIADWRMLVPNDIDLGPVDEVLPWWLWTVSLGRPTAGTFQLTFGAHSTIALAYNATAGTVQTALSALAPIGSGNVIVSGAAGGPYTVRLTGDRQSNEDVITATFSALTDGDGSIFRPVFSVLGVEDVATDAPQMTVYLTRRR